MWPRESAVGQFAARRSGAFQTLAVRLVLLGSRELAVTEQCGRGARRDQGKYFLRRALIAADEVFCAMGS